MRFYFDMKREGVPVRDHRGQEFSLISEAIIHAKALAARLRAAPDELKRGLQAGLRICVTNENSEIIHEELVYPQFAEG